MSRTKFIARCTVEANAAFDADLREGLYTDADRGSFVTDWVSDALSEAEQEAAEERELFGAPEDTPCLQSADLWGTGEGRYHGIIG